MQRTAGQVKISRFNPLHKPCLVGSNMRESNKKPTVLIVLDGWGYREESKDNAIAHATGVRLRDLPMRPEALKAALGA